MRALTQGGRRSARGFNGPAGLKPVEPGPTAVTMSRTARRHHRAAAVLTVAMAAVLAARA
jgi:hypothetical protein